ncbi:hypothetical protein ACWCP6_05465 [Streptomyces sp. NPDC002004]
MSMQHHVVRIDELLAQPLGDDGYRMVTLHQSRDFYDVDDAWDEAMRVNEEFERELEELAKVLDERWGPREEMSMEDYAGMDPDEEDDIPPLFRELCENGYFGDLLYWQVGERRVAVSVGHEDKEEPIVLFAAVTSSTEGFAG